MKFTHPVEIPMSKDLAFEWLGERIVPVDENMKGDTHPLTWANDDNIYTGTGDPCWMMRDGKTNGKTKDIIAKELKMKKIDTN